jgi:hypothetical protein
MTYLNQTDNRVIVTAPVTGTITHDADEGYRITDLDGRSHSLMIDRCDTVRVAPDQVVNRGDTIATTEWDRAGDCDEGLVLAEHAVDVVVDTLVESHGGRRVDAPYQPNRPYCVGVVTPAGMYTITAEYGEVTRVTGPGINELCSSITEFEQLISEA